MIGKITVIKSLILPNLTFLASVTTISKNFLNEFKTLIYNFIWGNKKEKVKRITLCKDYLEGGLKMINIDNFLSAIQLSWVKRLTSTHFANWKVIPLFFFNIFGENFSLFNMNPGSIKAIPNLSKTLPLFYLEIIKSWFKIKNISNKNNITFINIYML